MSSTNTITKEQFSRTELLLGAEAMERLQKSRVAVFGVGGVGGYAAEALVRSGLGAMELVDDDVVTVSNLNRQIIALHSTLGRPKVEVMKERLLDINPEVRVTARRCFFLPENSDEFNFANYDYVVDAVDTITAKLALIESARQAGTPVISSMGAGNKLDPSAFTVADIYETSVCPLAKVMRRELKKRGIESLKVVYSKEMPLRNTVPVSGGAEGEPQNLGAVSEEAGMEEHKTPDTQRKGRPKTHVPGSTAFVPPAAGLLIASEVIADLCLCCRNQKN